MKKIYLLFVTFILFSCVGGKYTYLFDTGKELDFNKGKWLLNKTESNSTKFDNELYYASHKKFEEILGDSLIDINTLRINKLVSPKISFELNSLELEHLRRDTECDFLINVRGHVISNGANSLVFENENRYYNASNRSSVSILIYDLNSGSIISSSQVSAKSTNESSHFENDGFNDSAGGFSGINPSAETLMVKAVKKLIIKYDKNRLD